jgi:hypothetical protein
MTLTGVKRKVNKSLKAWVAFVKKVQKEEKLSYKDAIHRAKQRKDKGEKWMTGGADPENNELGRMPDQNPTFTHQDAQYGTDSANDSDVSDETQTQTQPQQGGRRRRRTMRRSRGRGRGRTARRARGRASRRH